MKKGLKIAIASILSISIAGGAMFYLSQSVIKYRSIGYNITPGLPDAAKPYPYADIEVPDDFRACSVKGIDFYAPDGLDWMYPFETEGVKSGILVDNSDEQERDLLICVLDPEEPVESFGNDVTLADVFDEKTKKGMAKLGYEVPTTYYDFIYLLNTIKPEDCNQFSISEVNALYKLETYKGVMAPAFMSYKLNSTETGHNMEAEDDIYYYNNGNMRSFVRQGSDKNGAYELMLEVYDVNDLNTYQTVMIIGKDMDTVRQIAKTVTIAEE